MDYRLKGNLILVISMGLIIYSVYRLSKILAKWDLLWFGLFILAIMIGYETIIAMDKLTKPEPNQSNTTQENTK